MPATKGIHCRKHRNARSLGHRNNQNSDVRDYGPLILENLAKGGHFAKACRAAGISPHTGNLWRRLGRLQVGEHEDTCLARPEHIAFEEAVEETLAKFEMRILGYWVAAAETNWQAARDLLARRFPQRWGNAERREIQMRANRQMELQLVWGDEDHYQHLPISLESERGESLLLESEV